MKDTGLADLARFALRATGAQRGMAVNSDGEVVARLNLSEDDLQDEAFSGFVNIEKALASDKSPYITNNVFLSSETAPNTNTNFVNLRLVVVFLLGAGAIYIDQPLREGVIEQAVLERVQRLAETWAAAGTTLAVDEMVRQYEATEN